MIFNTDYIKEKCEKLKDKNHLLSLLEIFTKDKNADDEHRKVLNEIINFLGVNKQ